jgi:two-component system, cell cycle response regulator DivK
MDIKMPHMDGHTAAKLIKEFRPELPIIAQTAYALKSEIERFSDIFNDYLTKPIDENELKDKLLKYFIQ